MTGGDRTAPDVSMLDHLRSTDESPVVPGVYRVVGTADPLALLRVGDADGRRVTTGKLVRVERADLTAFEPAENPDGNRPTGERAARFVADLGWQLRAFWAGLRARPVASLAAVALLVAGHQGERFLEAPSTAFTAVYFLGVFALVYLGSRGG